MAGAENRELRHNVIRNTVFLTIEFVVGMIVAFFMTPVLLHYLGADQYAVIIIMSIAQMWMRMMDCGLSNGLIRFLSYAYARKDAADFNGLLALGGVFYLFYGLLFGVPIFVFAPEIGEFVFGDLGRDPAVVTYIRINAAHFFLTSYQYLAFYALAAMQRRDIASKVDLVVILLNIGATVAILMLGGGLDELAWLALGLMALAVAVSYLCIARIGEGVSLSLRNCSGRRFGELISFGWRTYPNDIFTLFIFKADKLVTLMADSLSGVTFYQLGASVMDKIRSVGKLHHPAMISAFANLDARNEEEASATLFVRGTKYTSLILITLTIFVVVFAEELIVLWLGQRYDMAIDILRILAGGYVIYALASVLAYVDYVVGNPQSLMKGGIVALIVCFAAYRPLVDAFHVPGIGITVSLALTAYAATVFVIFGRMKKFPFRTFLVNVGRICLCAAAVAVPLIAVKYWAAEQLFGANRWECLALLTPCAVGYGAALLFLFWKTGLIDAYDVGTVRDFFHMHRRPSEPGASS